MTSISIIGAGNMATAIGGRAAANGHTVEIIGRNPAKAKAAADRIGHGATVGAYGSRPTGDTVFVAVLAQHAVDVVKDFGDALAGKVLVDITNPFNANGTGVVTTPGNSVAQQIAAVVPAGTQVLKAFNTIFRDMLANATPLDALFAGGDAQTRARFGEFLTSIGIRPLDTGGLDATHALEWAAIVLMGIARNGGGWNAALAASIR